MVVFTPPVVSNSFYVLADERQRAHLAEQQYAAQEEERKMMENKLQDLERNQKERVEQLKKKQRDDVQALMDKNVNILESRLAEQKALIEQGFAHKAQALQEKIQQLKKDQAELTKAMNEGQKPNFFSWGAQKVGSALTAVKGFLTGGN